MSEKEAAGHRVSYSGYTITDYLTLCEGSIFAASSKLAPLREKQDAHIRAIINSKKHGLTCQHVEAVLFEFYAALQHILFFPVGLKQPSRGEWNPRKVKIN